MIIQPDLFAPAEMPFSLATETEQDGARVQEMLDGERDEKRRNEKAQIHLFDDGLRRF